MRILVIEDDPHVARAFLRMFYRKEHFVAVEIDGHDGIERALLAEDRGAPFELVLCDYLLRRMTGIDVLATLGHRCRVLPLRILFSGTGCVEHAASVADALLAKPFRARDVDRAISQIKLARRRPETRRIRKQRAHRPTPCGG